MNINEINDLNSFTAQISSGVSVVEFWAPWCGPCKVQAPIFEQVAEETLSKGLNVKFSKVDIDQNNDIAKHLGLQSIPCMMIFKDGQEQKTLIGTQRKSVMTESIEKAASL
jgi:thioredoxin 1